MGLFGKKPKTETKCDVCDLELPTPERLERHKKKRMAMYQRKKWMILAQDQAKVACGSQSDVKNL